MQARQIPGTERMVVTEDRFRELPNWNNRSILVISSEDRRGLFRAHMPILVDHFDLAERAMRVFLMGHVELVAVPRQLEAFNREVVALTRRGISTEMALTAILNRGGQQQRVAAFQPGAHGRLMGPPTGRFN